MLYPTAGQGYVFLMCVYGGVACALLYELMAEARALCGNRLLPTIAFDFLFCVCAVGGTGLLALKVNGGALHWYMLLGLAAGFGLFRLTLARLMRRAALAAHKWLRKATAGIARRVRTSTKE